MWFKVTESMSLAKTLLLSNHQKRKKAHRAAKRFVATLQASWWGLFLFYMKINKTS